MTNLEVHDKFQEVWQFLGHFVVGWYDGESDEAVCRRYATSINLERYANFIREAEIIVSLKPFPVEGFEQAANRYFENNPTRANEWFMKMLRLVKKFYLSKKGSN